MEEQDEAGVAPATVSFTVEVRDAAGNLKQTATFTGKTTLSQEAFEQQVFGE